MQERIGEIPEQFSPIQFIKDIARVSRVDDKIPNERDIGRECYAFSKQEDEAFGVAEQAARGILDGYIEGTDYEITHDAIGNMFIRLISNHPKAPAIMIGSHLDSVANGGMYDGVAGVAVALDTLAKTLNQPTLKRPQQDLIVAVWRSEESSPRNGIACLGSSIATGALSEAQLNSIYYDRQNNVLLRDHITKRGREKNPPDSKAWDKVLALAKNPYWDKEKIGAYFEAHIEQSAVVLKNKKDIGIVTGGIGGARRDQVERKFTPESIEVKEGEYKKMTLSFLGEPTHTGGTPPNPRFFKDRKGLAWYRKDALVAASLATNKLLRIPGVKLLRMGPDRATGFTSVPGHQEVELLLPVAQEKTLTKELLGLKSHTRAKQQVEMTADLQGAEEVPASTIAFVSRKAAREILNLPIITSLLSTEAFNREGTETGTTRATMTDFYLRPDGVTYNLDLREVNVADLDRLINEIHKHTNLILGEGVFKTISIKTHAPVDEVLVNRLKHHAERLGVSFVLMPSMPGHDADRMAAIGIRTAMVFIGHDGLSHNPKEAMAASDFAKASKVMQEAIGEMQGIDSR